MYFYLVLHLYSVHPIPCLANVVIERPLLVKVTNPPLQLHPVLALLTACTIYSLFSGSAAVRISTIGCCLVFAAACGSGRPTFVPATRAAPRPALAGPVVQSAVLRTVIYN